MLAEHTLRSSMVSAWAFTRVLLEPWFSEPGASKGGSTGWPALGCGHCEVQVAQGQCFNGSSLLSNGPGVCCNWQAKKTWACGTCSLIFRRGDLITWLDVLQWACHSLSHWMRLQGNSVLTPIRPLLGDECSKLFTSLLGIPLLPLGL